MLLRTFGLITLIAVTLFALSGQTRTAIEIKPIGNPDAPQGGIFYKALGAEPESLHPISSTDLYSTIVQGPVFDTLLMRNIDSYEFEPYLAESWEVSRDGMVFTFVLREGAKWHDGKPVTVEDVKFSFEAIKDPRFLAARSMPYYENIEKAEIVDSRTIRFTASQKYFNNFSVLATLTVVPKHFYGDPDKRVGREMVGSGPYRLHRYDGGRSIVLHRNKDWWGNEVDHLKGANKFDQIFFRIIREENMRLAQLQRGNLDFGELSADQFVRQTRGRAWGRSVHKQQVENKAPKSYGYVGWNLRNPLFQDRRVRLALAHLMDREDMNRKFRHNMSLLATGPWYRQNPFADSELEPIGFNPKRAQELLTEAGWEDKERRGILSKEIDGQRQDFRFTLMFANRDNEKYMTQYKEALKNAGIDMTIRLLEWNSLVRALDERNFDAVQLGWGGGSVDVDPKQIWHTESMRDGGSNYIGYSNPKVDKLIDEARQELNREERIKKLQEVYRQIAADAPYAFMFVDRYQLYAHSDRMGMEKPTYSYGIGDGYWWITK